MARRNGNNRPEGWKNRIVGEGIEAPDQLLANPANWRIHPKHQQDALDAVLDRVGWVQRVIVNKRTGHIVDGHLRVSMAISRNEPGVPVVYVDLSEDEERVVLATLDPISAMAATDSAKLAEVLAGIENEDAVLRAVLEQIVASENVSIDAVDSVDAPEVDSDRAEELRQKWDTRPGDIWRAGDQIVECGDSTSSDVVARVHNWAESYDLIFDPPWDVVLPNCYPDATNVIVCADGARFRDVLAQFGADPAWVFTWDCVTSWYTQNRPLRRAKYAIWYGDVKSYNPDGAHFGDAGESRQVSNSRGTYQFEPDARGKHLSDVFQTPITKLHSDGSHSHEKPLDWWRLLIGNCTRQPVVDPFAGSGVTAVSCQQLSRRSYSVELHPPYVALVVEKLAQMGVEPKREVAG